MPSELPTNSPASGQPAGPGSGGIKSAQPRHDGSFEIAVLAGIPIRIHVSFLLILAWAVFGGIRGGAGLRILWVLTLFSCVVLHELGHALVARRYNIRTRSIVLYPIGGVASLETQPRPRDELWIALAGPAVNLVIALALWGIQALAGLPSYAPGAPITAGSYLAALLEGNLLLAAFNMVPAFPMDGGRVLRALLARVMDEAAATALAARIGQILALAFGLFAFYQSNFLWLLVAVFVYFGAGQEAAAFKAKTLVAGHRVREALLKEFHTLPPGATLRGASDLLLAGSQQDFPIVHGEEVVGILSRSALMRGIATQGWDAYVTGVMDRDFTVVHPEDDLETILAQGTFTSPILAMEQDASGNQKLVGMLTQENLLEFLTLAQLRARVGAPV